MANEMIELHYPTNRSLEDVAQALAEGGSDVDEVVISGVWLMVWGWTDLFGNRIANLCDVKGSIAAWLLATEGR